LVRLLGSCGLNERTRCNSKQLRGGRIQRRTRTRDLGDGQEMRGSRLGPRVVEVKASDGVNLQIERRKMEGDIDDGCEDVGSTAKTKTWRKAELTGCCRCCDSVIMFDGGYISRGVRFVFLGGPWSSTMYVIGCAGEKNKRASRYVCKVVAKMTMEFQRMEIRGMLRGILKSKVWLPAPATKVRDCNCNCKQWESGATRQIVCGSIYHSLLGPSR
jgi:hypothetical protein